MLIEDITLIQNYHHDDFLEEVGEKIKYYQDNGYEVDVQYAISGRHHCALLIAKKR